MLAAAKLVQRLFLIRSNSATWGPHEKRKVQQTGRRQQAGVLRVEIANTPEPFPEETDSWFRRFRY
jgi:hypothetical protein